MKKDNYHGMQLITNNIKIKEYEFFVVTMKGTIPRGSEGNLIVEECFRKMSENINLLESPSPFLVYNCLDIDYDFGDHMGAFFWVLPALLDNIGIIVAARGETLSNMKYLASFIGSWLPIIFMESIENIWSQLDEKGLELKTLQDKTKQCRDIVRSSQDREKPIPIVIYGSRQTGWQFKSGNYSRKTSDIDYGIIGNPKDLAIFASSPWRDLSNTGHPPAVLFNSADDAVSQGFFVIYP